MVLLASCTSARNDNVADVGKTADARFSFAPEFDADSVAAMKLSAQNVTIAIRVEKGKSFNLDYCNEDKTITESFDEAFLLSTDFHITDSLAFSYSYDMEGENVTIQLAAPVGTDVSFDILSDAQWQTLVAAMRA